MRKFFASLLEVLEIAVIAVGAVFIVRTFLVQPFLVSGTSMVPTFSNGDYVLTDELTFRIQSPERGEVIVFHDVSDYSTYLIKRVIGLPGERVVINNNTVTIYNKQNPNGFQLDETYLPPGTITAGDEDITLSSSSYFMMGDNRAVSYDSRSWGPLPASDIVGLVRFRLWPLNAIQIFSAPQYTVAASSSSS
ncbi:MAG TPA: signal peptidase I [Candidatus Paceibacterota bacterium]|nr:signal peptidase I [Candidatus Paceibacterota bacterium]